MSFEEKVYHDDPRFVKPCMDWITDSNGNIIVDFIGYMETLQESFNQICEIIRAPQKILQNNGKSNRKSNYREYYNNKTADLVEQAFKQDIMEFNYEF